MVGGREEFAHDADGRATHSRGPMIECGLAGAGFFGGAAFHDKGNEKRYERAKRHQSQEADGQGWPGAAQVVKEFESFRVAMTA